jgi:MFS superfamily sulfate permease-like transporter
MVFMIPLIEWIPNAALAAMLIYAGYRLAAPAGFIHMYQIGKEQLAVFVLTILVTLLEDLLLGVFSGIILKLLFHLYHGARFGELFQANYETNEIEGKLCFQLRGSALFSNLLGFKRALAEIPEGEDVVFDVSAVRLIDHSFMNFITQYREQYQELHGRSFEIRGLERLQSMSEHPLSCRYAMK